MRFRNWVGLAVLVLLLLVLLSQTITAYGEVPGARPVHGPDLGWGGTQAQDQVTLTLTGRVINTQELPVDDAEVQVLIGGERKGSDHTDEDGFYVIELTLRPALLEMDQITIEIGKAGFRTQRQDLDRERLATVGDCCLARVPDVVLARTMNQAFFLATAIFVLVFAIISLNLLHETIAAFLGAAAMLGISYLIGAFSADYWILGFERAVDYIDLDVIFLIMTLMIVVSVIGHTGLFQWLALQAYRSARGSAWRLAILLMIATAAMSAFLNNVTIMLLMAPITIEIALMLEINPTALLVPEAMASNIGGIATLIGDPPNTIIGSYAGLGFNQFLIHMGPIAVIATVTLISTICIIYRRDYARARKTPSPALLARLERDAQITDPVTLRRTLVVIGLMLVLFFAGEFFHMPPSVVGLIGAAALLVWVRPNVEAMLSEVDWTTLMFFICLFIVVGGVQEVGLIQWIADSIAGIAGDDLFMAMQAVIWLSAVASAIVNNIPFTTAFLPIAGYLSQTIPGASNNVLYWSLSLGANLGGNATYVGSAPNVVAAGYLERAGSRVSFVDWLKIGAPVTLVTILVPTLWMIVRYFWLKF
jgi:Na+/H+ antiporter NhaD/arsenite permease-like protein